MTLDSCIISEKKPLLSVEEAQKRLLQTLVPLSEKEFLPLKHALGRVLTEDVFAPFDLPLTRNSAMDGYAFSSHLFSETLINIGTSWAGKPFEGELKAGECVRIFTGAVLPINADSVVIQEQVIENGSQITLHSDVKIKKNVREIGEDVQKGGILCHANKVLSAVDLGLFASAGIEQVSVIRKLKIAYFSTGDELIALGHSLSFGKIYDSNRYSLYGLLQKSNYDSMDGGIIPDDKAELKRIFTQIGSTFDVLITTGGASVGDADFVKEVLEECGEVNFWKIAMKPGKPLAFGKIGECYFFGLPGNPVAVTTLFDIMIKSALARLGGENVTKPFQMTAICLSPLKKSRGRQEYQRGILQQLDSGELQVRSAGHQGSHILSSASLANCYIVLPTHCENVQIGETVNIILISN